MLRKGKVIALIVSMLYLFSCGGGDKKSILIDNDFSTPKNPAYNSVWHIINDSISNCVRCGLSPFNFVEFNKSWRIDTFLCFNSQSNRLVSCILQQHNASDANSDGIDFLYGEKMEGKWYFFLGAHIVLPREFYQKNVHTPLSFEKLHEIALKEVYSGYLRENNEGKYEINNLFFKEAFENVGWCADCKTSDEYRTSHVRKSKGVWLEKYSPYKKEDIDFKYDKQKREINLSFKLQTPDSFYLEPTGYRVRHKINDGNMVVSKICGHTAFCEIDWKKEKIAKASVQNVLPGSKVEIFIEQAFDGHQKSSLMGPYLFELPK